MCRTTVEQIWWVIGERFNLLVNALFRAASHANVCSGTGISGSVGCVSNDCNMDFVDNKDNLYAQQYEDEIFVPTKHHGKHLALYEPPMISMLPQFYLEMPSSFAGLCTWLCRRYQACVRRLVTSLRRRLVAVINARVGPPRYWKIR